MNWILLFWPVVFGALGLVCLFLPGVFMGDPERLPARLRFLRAVLPTVRPILWFLPESLHLLAVRACGVFSLFLAYYCAVIAFSPARSEAVRSRHRAPVVSQASATPREGARPQATTTPQLTVPPKATVTPATTPTAEERLRKADGLMQTAATEWQAGRRQKSIEMAAEAVSLYKSVHGESHPVVNEAQRKLDAARQTLNTPPK